MGAFVFDIGIGFYKDMRIGRHWIKACVGVLLFAAFDVNAAPSPVLGVWKLRFRRYYDSPPDLPEKTRILPGGAEIKEASCISVGA